MNRTVMSWFITAVLTGVLTACTGEQAAETPKSSVSEQAQDKLSAATVELSSKVTPEPPQAGPADPALAPAPSSAAGAVYGNGKPPAASPGPKNPEGPIMKDHPKPKEPPSQTSTAGDRKVISWYYMKKPKGQVPGFPGDTKKYTKDMKALWVGTGKKVYLTIDTGGPLGDIDLLVKSLKDNDVKANFFIAGYNVKKNPDFIRTLVKDGHLVANHTMTHSDMNTQTDEQVRKEIEDYEQLYKEVTGKEIQPFFRFPYGRYNMHLLQMVSDMGYTSVFWSTAMRDWEPRKNGAEDPYNDIMNNLHDGNIILMHQGSPENIEALDRIIKAVHKAGYEFALLNDI
ncbi:MULTISPECIES: polysaccharide deacetylase family protein [unclassified Paenibacillus]|uniref:polysaccharide deacetylase family protein n=1 Tax=unclassified Paenibacillus TaxID=185978 RepID=UPI001AEAC0F7|nr:MULTISPECIES: polysaccharide deacetylase family protein [unclassified Paenibacillus]MBP1154713.1 peptidoglycan-N-acetylmuramic acid deacetylase [Paenibacillus sp. PvP091]MBP1169903.1 peptidoglycan-N-acetylmuramic acid deacetylase [Paenibacillus sp. PvR098]MBP2440931.1 peptidoglycan-N-acetylmuramic acid deacetylase [Paenibacillus sp. PvP052]